MVMTKFLSPWLISCHGDKIFVMIFVTITKLSSWWQNFWTWWQHIFHDIFSPWWIFYHHDNIIITMTNFGHDYKIFITMTKFLSLCHILVTLANCWLWSKTVVLNVRHACQMRHAKGPSAARGEARGEECKVQKEDYPDRRTLTGQSQNCCNCITTWFQCSSGWPKAVSSISLNTQRNICNWSARMIFVNEHCGTPSKKVKNHWSKSSVSKTITPAFST